MKKITFQGQEYTVPQSWKDVTVGMQIKASKIENEEQYVKNIGLISAYTGIDVDVLKKTNIKEVIDILKHLAFLNEDVKTEPIFTFEFKGDTYYVAPNIMEQEFQDYVAAQTAMANFKEDYWKQLSYLMAINAKKEGETLDDFNINERAKLFEDIDVVTVSGVAAFFLSNRNLLERLTQLSSKEEINKVVLKSLSELESTNKTLKEVRGGNLLIHLWSGISLKYAKSLKQQWEKYYNSLQ